MTKTYLLNYVSALLSMLLLDGIWLGLIAKRLYLEKIGHLMATNPNFIAAGFFYLIYILGLVVLVTIPNIKSNGNYLQLLLMGGLYGLVCYATYDLTNQATLKDWPLIVTIIDLLWGTFLTAIIAFTSVLITKALIT